MTTLTKIISRGAEATASQKAESREATGSDILKTHFVGQSILQNRSDVRVMGALKEPKRLIGAEPSAISDVSSISRNGAVVAGGTELISYDPSTDIAQPLMSLTLPLFFLSASLNVVEVAKRYQYCEKTGDADGKIQALAALGYRIPLAAAGGTALLKNALQVYDIAQTLQNVNYQPIAEVSQSMSILGSTTLVLLGLFNAALTAFSALHLYQKYQTKKEVMAFNPEPEKIPCDKTEENPFGYTLQLTDDMRGWIAKRLDVAEEVKTHKKEEFIELALEEGEKWLSKLEKDWKKIGCDPLNVSKEQRKALVKELFMKNDDMVTFTGIAKKGQDLIIAFGEKLMTERLQAREEQKLIRTVGQAVIDKYKTTTEEIKKAEVVSAIDKGMNQNGILIFLGVLGVIACVSAMVFTGGIPALCVALMFVLSSLVWLFAGGDGSSVLRQLKGEQTGKFDKAMLIFSSLLNMVAIVGTIASMIIFTGGIALVPLVLLLTVGLFWAAVNARGIYNYTRHSLRPWEYEKVVSLASFSKLVEKEDRNDEIKKVFLKMSKADRDLFQGSENWKHVTRIIIRDLADNKAAQLQELNRYTRNLVRS